MLDASSGLNSASLRPPASPALRISRLLANLTTSRVSSMSVSTPAGAAERWSEAVAAAGAAAGRRSSCGRRIQRGGGAPAVTLKPARSRSTTTRAAVWPELPITVTLLPPAASTRTAPRRAGLAAPAVWCSIVPRAPARAEIACRASGAAALGTSGRVPAALQAGAAGLTEPTAQKRACMLCGEGWGAGGAGAASSPGVRGGQSTQQGAQLGRPVAAPQCRPRTHGGPDRDAGGPARRGARLSAPHPRRSAGAGTAQEHQGVRRWGAGACAGSAAAAAPAAATAAPTRCTNAGSRRAQVWRVEERRAAVFRGPAQVHRRPVRAHHARCPTARAWLACSPRVARCRRWDWHVVQFLLALIPPGGVLRAACCCPSRVAVVLMMLWPAHAALSAPAPVDAVMLLIVQWARSDMERTQALRTQQVRWGGGSCRAGRVACSALLGWPRMLHYPHHRRSTRRARSRPCWQSTGRERSRLVGLTLLDRMCSSA